MAILIPCSLFELSPKYITYILFALKLSDIQSPIVIWYHEYACQLFY